MTEGIGRIVTNSEAPNAHRIRDNQIGKLAATGKPASQRIAWAAWWNARTVECPIRCNAPITTTKKSASITAYSEIDCPRWRCRSSGLHRHRVSFSQVVAIAPGAVRKGLGSEGALEWSWESAGFGLKSGANSLLRLRPCTWHESGGKKLHTGAGWSGRRGSNPRHPAWEAGVLPLNYSRSAG